MTCRPGFWLALLLAVSVGLSVSAIATKSITADEHAYPFTGYYYMQSGDLDFDRYRHPPLIKAWQALPWLLQRPALKLRPDRPNARLAFYADHNDFDALIFTARAMGVPLVVLLSVLVFVWAKQISDSPTRALVAVSMTAFCPTLMAWGVLATTDYGAALALCGAYYLLWRWLRGDGVRWFWLSSLAYAGAMMCRYNSPYFAPAFLLAVVAYDWRLGWRHVIKRIAATIGGFSLVSFVVINLCYIWRLEYITASEVDIYGGLAAEWIGPDTWLPLPANYIHGLAGQVYATSNGWPGMIMGTKFTDGPWYYHPVAFVIKSALAFLALVVIGALNTRRITPKHRRDALMILIPVLLTFVYLGTYNKVAIGVRHALIVWPLLAVFAGATIDWSGSRASRLLAGSLLAWNLAACVVAWPHYISYFNEAIGGSRNGHKWLIDSNVSIGQNDNQRLPDHIAVQPRVGTATTQLIAIDANNPWGGGYGFLRNTEPIDVVANSWLIYDLDDYGATANLTQLADLYGTVKSSMHHYTDTYHKFFAPMRNEVTDVLEIGVLEGASLRMWRSYFPRANVVGIDILDTSHVEGQRIRTWVADQADREQLRRFGLLHEHGFDLILDDGGHTMEQQQVSFGVLFRLVRSGGYYVIEDVHTSVMPKDKYGAEPDGSNTTLTMLQTFVRTGRIESQYLIKPEHEQLERWIAELNFLRTDNGSMSAIVQRR